MRILVYKFLTWLNSDLAGFYNLSGGIVIPDGANIQNYRTPGNYYCTNNAHVATLLNCPIKNAFTMKVEYGSGNGYPIQTIRDYYTRKQYINTYYTDENSKSYKTIKAYPYTSNKKYWYFVKMNNGVWQGWEKYTSAI